MSDHTRDVVPEVRSRLTARAFLFEDAAAYQAGVDETLAALGPHVRPSQPGPEASRRPDGPRSPIVPDLAA